MHHASRHQCIMHSITSCSPDMLIKAHRFRMHCARPRPTPHAAPPLARPCTNERLSLKLGVYRLLDMERGIDT
eukprot:7702052-Pyramimonas_sp.AAC.1